MPLSFFWTEDGPDCAGELMSAMAVVRCSVLVGEDGSGIGGDCVVVVSGRRTTYIRAGWPGNWRPIGTRSRATLMCDGEVRKRSSQALEDGEACGSGDSERRATGNSGYREQIEMKGRSQRG